jgi:hypothetical protein
MQEVEGHWRRNAPVSQEKKKKKTTKKKDKKKGGKHEPDRSTDLRTRRVHQDSRVAGCQPLASDLAVPPTRMGLTNMTPSHVAGRPAVGPEPRPAVRKASSREEPLSRSSARV